MNDNELQQVTMNDKKWQRMTASGTKSDNESQRVTISANYSFFFFQTREEPITKHSKENKP